LIAAPYITYISLEAGTFTFSKKKSSAGMVLSMAPTQTAQSPSPPIPPAESAKPSENNAGGRLWSAAHNFYVFQQPLVNGIHLIVLLPALCAFWYLKPNQQPQQRVVKRLLSSLTLLHLLVLIALSAQQGPSYVGGHHTFLIALYMVPFAGAGLAGALDWLRAHRRTASWATPALATLLIAVTLPSSVFRRPESGAVYRTAGLWIRDHGPARPTVITDSAKLAYHADAIGINAAGDSSMVVDMARRIKADFIALSADGQESDFQRHVDSGALEIAARLSERSGSRTYRVIVYRLRSPQP
jgi:hypothetical protein